VAALLEERLGAEVVLTRNEDIYVALEERTRIANQHKADLFRRSTRTLRRCARWPEWRPTI
jgi:N-acetylmuramoyl-L-alanine amidase